MTPEEIHQRLEGAGHSVTYQSTTPDPHIAVPREQLERVALFLKEDPDLAFDSLMCLSGVDRGEELEVVYHLLSYKHRHRVTLKVRLPKDNPVVPTVSSLWPTAEWHEREAYDLVGMSFEGHPDHRRILLPDDWEGHPLRKDYVPPDRWHDIPLIEEPLNEKNEPNERT
jgi:NADH-quinone oxidoreductase subunit C